MKIMEYSKCSYSREEEFIRLHVSMVNFETKSNGRIDRQEHVTMIILQREVQIYRDDNEMIMKSWEEILQSLNMLQRKANKESGTKQPTSSRQVKTSRSHSRRYEHGNDNNSRSVNRGHHSLRKSIRRAHASSWLGSSPSVSRIRRQWRRLEGDILKGELGKIKPPNFNGENSKGEEVEAYILEMKKYF
jgi:hypothetical protein